MAILGMGIDIVENYRVKEILLKKKSNFKKKNIHHKRSRIL